MKEQINYRELYIIVHIDWYSKKYTNLSLTIDFHTFYNIFTSKELRIIIYEVFSGNSFNKWYSKRKEYSFVLHYILEI